MDILETLKINLERLRKVDEDSEQIPCLEKYVQGEILALLDAEEPFREVVMNILKRGLPAEAVINNFVQFSGSLVEGAMCARFFQENTDLEIEVDIMLNQFTIPKEVSHLLELVKDKLGFVRLHSRLCPDSFIDKYQLRAKQLLGTHGNDPYPLDQIWPYISPLVMRDLFKLCCDQNLAYESGLMRRLNNFANMADAKIENSTTATTMEQQIQFPKLFSWLPSWSIDGVPAVNLHFWPWQAANWIVRDRVWPPHVTIQDIVEKGCQIVPRSSPDGDIHREWRLSFSRPEAILAQLRNKNQQRAYCFFKIFFYQYLKCVESSETEGKKLYSYIIKTIMLWACEELHPEDPIWASLEKSVQILLFKLLGSLEKGFLSHYFIPEINLLERINEDVKEKCIAVINRWQNNILMTAPFDILEKLEYINNFSNIFSIAQSISFLAPVNSEYNEVLLTFYRNQAVEILQKMGYM